jgi:hypothetical protein
MKLSYQFIDALKAASLDDDELDDEDIYCLHHPPTEPLDVEDNLDFRLSLDLFLSLTNSSQESYTKVRAAILRRHPEDPILSYDQIRRWIKDLTGVIPVVHHMCINSCMAYTGPSKISRFASTVPNLGMIK